VHALLPEVAKVLPNDCCASERFFDRWWSRAR